MKELELLLHEQLLILKELILYAGRQQQALIHLSADELDKITLAQQELMAKMHQKEQMRWRILSQMTGNSLKEAASITLSGLIDNLPETQRPFLQSMQADFAQAVKKLHELNTTNRVLATRARTNAKEILNIFTEHQVFVLNTRV